MRKVTCVRVDLCRRLLHRCRRRHELGACRSRGRRVRWLGQRERELGRRAAVRAQDVSDDGGVLAYADGSAADAGYAATKYVASRTIQPTWENTHLLKGDLLNALQDVKATDGPDITLLGSGSVAAQLGEASLVDEYQFVIIPVGLGGGRTVFAKGQMLRLLNQRAFRCGNVVVTYAT